MKYLIVGLGNVGTEYELTRHNIGFLVLDFLADQKKQEFSTKRLADHAIIKHKGRSIHLIKPNTYMNLSGKALAWWMNDLRIPLENVLVVVDDIALPFGKVRVRGKGSAAGHNGLKNIEFILQSQNYARLRLGIGDEFPKGSQVDYVLSNFTGQEMERLPPLFEKSAEIILSFCTQGIEKTMGQFNA